MASGITDPEKEVTIPGHGEITEHGAEEKAPGVVGLPGVEVDTLSLSFEHSF